MTIKRLVILYLVLAVVMFIAAALLSGCASGNGRAPDNQWLVGSPAPEYKALVSVYNAENSPVRRELLCTIAGFGPNKAPAYVTDERTGATSVYVIEVSAKAPARIIISNYANLYTIDVQCSAVPARPGDVIFCEFVDHAERGPVPLIMSIPEARAVEVVGIPGRYVATCVGVINALA